MNMQIFAGFRYRGECNSSLPDLALLSYICACAGFYIAMHLGYYAEAQIEVSMVIPDDRYGVVPIGKVCHLAANLLRLALCLQLLESIDLSSAHSGFEPSSQFDL